MNTIVTDGMVWKQSGIFSNKTELLDHGKTIASLQFNSAFGTLATGTFGEHEWTFKRVGFWKPQITIRKSGMEQEIAIFTPRFPCGGELTVDNSRAYQWKRGGMLSSDYAFYDASDRPVVGFHKKAFSLHERCTVHYETGTAQTDCPILTLLGWYLLILESRESVAMFVSVS